tara:strand:- start:13235 stop:14305 length:1071 start_codon:yes stop_codon:yes gene_type:complete
MKIALTADVHLISQSKTPERFSALNFILQNMEQEQIDTLIIAGDLFDQDQSNVSEIENLLKDYPGFSIHIIPGNHDENIQNSHFSGEQFCIHEKPTVVKLGNSHFGFVPFKKDKKMGEIISEIQNKIDGKDWILISHGDFYAGRKEQNPLEPGEYMPLTRNDLSKYKPKLTFLGHIHKPQFLENSVYYLGSPCGLDITETGKRRFLIFDTNNFSIKPTEIKTDIIYIQESFTIFPSEDEIQNLRTQIRKRIESWKLDNNEKNKVRLRIEVRGYCENRKKIIETTKSAFQEYSFHDDDGPDHKKLSTIQSNSQLNKIAQRVISKIENEEDWNFIDGEPTKNDIVWKALETIYGSISK